MAIIKKVNLENGVTVNYHRIVSINNIINVASIIEVASYTDKSKREEEKEKLKNKQNMNIFIDTKYMNIPYNENINVSDSYKYLKTLEKFQDCTDDL